MTKNQVADRSSKIAQSERFIETARTIGCDEDEAAFKERLKKLVAAPPSSAKKPNKPKPHKASK